MPTVQRVERYYRPLLNFARDEIRAYEAVGALNRGEVSPQDIVDEALLEAMRQDRTDPRRLYSRLRTLVRHAVERHVAQHRRERSLFEPIGGGRPDEAPSTPRRLVDILPDPTSPIPDQVVESLEFQQALATILRQLPTAWREPFILHIREGLSLQDVARMEGLPVGEVRRRIDMAREFLRAKLVDEYQDSLQPPPMEAIFEVLDSIQPTPEQLVRAQAQLEAAAA